MRSLADILDNMQRRDETPPVLREAIRLATLGTAGCEVRRVIDGEAQRHVEGRNRDEAA